ncbi:hypothetical protein COW46_03075 [Candidatus Gracilibacteria bacterium CG17_big_fil_post_rev_8_21_14_2_50_48_13]|nr:MAG: hypothetical protein COW46_03075 [Candidatus Gracilibacteria bacterium CG17_big_fil_post_rev_8_21_14_2_50_48_13]
MTAATTTYDKLLDENAARLQRLLAAFKNEYNYNTYLSSIRATKLLLTEALKDTAHMSPVELKMLISKLTEFELKKRGLPFPRLVMDAKGYKYYDMRSTNIVARKIGGDTDLKLLELPMNTMTVLIVTVMNDARMRLIAFTDDLSIPFIDVGDLFERAP